MATIPGLIDLPTIPKPPVAGQAATIGNTTDIAAPAGYTPTAAAASLATTNNWKVDAPQTVQGQIKTIIDSNSPLMQQAETTAKQSANRIGLINSSMAVGAGQDAVIRAALPIAQQDASTNAGSAQFNAGAANQASQTNANLTTSVNQNNAQASNQAAQAKFSAEEQAKQINAETANKAIFANLDAVTRSNITSLDAANKVELANIQAAYNNQIQASGDAAKLWDTHMNEIYKINADTNITDPAARASMIAGSLQRAKDGMALLSAISNINIRGVLADVTPAPAQSAASSPAAAPATTAAPVTAPAPAPAPAKRYTRLNKL